MRVQPNNNSIRMLPFDEYNHYAILSMAEADGKSMDKSTTDGFWVADQQTLEIRRLNITDKRFTSMFFDRTSGEFYLGTADGFAISSSEALLAEHTEKSLILTAIYINNQLYQPMPYKLMFHIPVPDAPALSHCPNKVSATRNG